MMTMVMLECVIYEIVRVLENPEEADDAWMRSGQLDILKKYFLPVS